jgi:hypothetical protein
MLAGEGGNANDRLFTHEAVFRYLKGYYETSPAGIQDTTPNPGEFQVDRYHVRFYDDGADPDNEDNLGTDYVVDRSYKEDAVHGASLVGISESPHYRGQWQLHGPCSRFEGHLVTRDAPCSCSDCLAGRFWRCQYTRFAGQFRDYYVHMKDNTSAVETKRKETNEKVRSDFVEALCDGDLLAFVCGKGVQFAKAQKYKSELVFQSKHKDPNKTEQRIYVQHLELIGEPADGEYELKAATKQWIATAALLPERGITHYKFNETYTITDDTKGRIRFGYALCFWG